MSADENAPRSGNKQRTPLRASSIGSSHSLVGVGFAPKLHDNRMVKDKFIIMDTIEQALKTNPNLDSNKIKFQIERLEVIIEKLEEMPAGSSCGGRQIIDVNTGKKELIYTRERGLERAQKLLKLANSKLRMHELANPEA